MIQFFAWLTKHIFVIFCIVPSKLFLFSHFFSEYLAFSCFNSASFGMKLRSCFLLLLEFVYLNQTIHFVLSFFEKYFVLKSILRNMFFNLFYFILHWFDKMRRSFIRPEFVFFIVFLYQTLTWWSIFWTFVHFSELFEVKELFRSQ